MSPPKLPPPWSFRKQSLDQGPLRCASPGVKCEEEKGAEAEKKKKKKGIGGNAGLHWPELHSDPPRAITGCGWLNNGPQRRPHPTPQACENAV